jgi:hypothetical protein
MHWGASIVDPSLGFDRAARAARRWKNRTGRCQTNLGRMGGLGAGVARHRNIPEPDPVPLQPASR